MHTVFLQLKSHCLEATFPKDMAGHAWQCTWQGWSTPHWHSWTMAMSTADSWWSGLGASMEGHADWYSAGNAWAADDGNPSRTAVISNGEDITMLRDAQNSQAVSSWEGQSQRMMYGFTADETDTGGSGWQRASSPPTLVYATPVETTPERTDNTTDLAYQEQAPSRRGTPARESKGAAGVRIAKYCQALPRDSFCQRGLSEDDVVLQYDHQAEQFRAAITLPCASCIRTTFVSSWASSEQDCIEEASQLALQRLLETTQIDLPERTAAASEDESGRDQPPEATCSICATTSDNEEVNTQTISVFTVSVRSSRFGVCTHDQASPYAIIADCSRYEYNLLISGLDICLQHTTVAWDHSFNRLSAEYHHRLVAENCTSVAGRIVRLKDDAVDTESMSSTNMNDRDRPPWLPVLAQRCQRLFFSTNSVATMPQQFPCQIQWVLRVRSALTRTPQKHCK